MDHPKTPLAPVNKLAAIVISPCEEYIENKKITQDHWDFPPETKLPPNNIKDLKGLKFGRMFVYGYYGSRDGARWIVRCVCGRYELRKSKAVLNPLNNIDCCQKCRHLDELKRNDEYMRTGKNKPR